MSVYEVTDYGAVAGTANSTSAFQDAIDAAGVAALEGVEQTVRVPEDEFTISTSTSSGGILWCLDLSYDNIVFENLGSITCSPASDASLFFVSGALRKARDVGNNHWYDYHLWEIGVTQPTTLYNLTGNYVKGQDHVILNSSADNANFVVGDWVGIRTGQTIDGGIGQPDAEINRITAISGATIYLRHGLKTDYAQEYFISGTSGFTSTSVTANPAPFAIANLRDRKVENVTIRLGTVNQQTATYPVYFGGQWIGFDVEDGFARCEGTGLESIGYGRNHTVRNVEVVVYDTINNSYWLTPGATTMTDHSYSDVTLSSDAPSVTHIHEGSGRISLRRVKMNCPIATGSHYMASIRGRQYDIDIDTCSFIGGGDLIGDCQIFIETDHPGAGTVSGRLHNCTSVRDSDQIFYATSLPVSNGWRFDGLETSLDYQPVVSRRTHHAGRSQ